VTTLNICECAEGFLVESDVLQGSSKVAEGCMVRIIFHSRHPVLKHREGWVLRRGCRLCIDGFLVVANGNNGPVILPQLVTPAM
jgi:hypothetical protein